MKTIRMLVVGLEGRSIAEAAGGRIIGETIVHAEGLGEEVRYATRADQAPRIGDHVVVVIKREGEV